VSNATDKVDWSWNWRKDCLCQTLFAAFDILCVPPLLFSVLTWRNSFFFAGYRAREALLKQNDGAAAVASAANDTKDEKPSCIDWIVDWRSECFEQTLRLIMDIACFPFVLIIIVGLWRIPFFLAGSRSRPQKEHSTTKSTDHDWAFASRSELLLQSCFFVLDLFFIFPVIVCIFSVWRIKFVKEMYEQELKDMATSSNKSDFPGQIRLRCLQQVIYLFLDILIIPSCLLLVVSFWRWGYIWRGLQMAGNKFEWPHDWAGDHRSFLLYQVRCMCFDLLCAPLVLLLIFCPWRLYTFWAGMRNPKVAETTCSLFFPADSITDHPSCWRFKAMQNVVFMTKDLLAAPFVMLSVFTWRNPFFRRAYRANTRLTLQKIQAGSKANESHAVTQTRAGQTAFLANIMNQEISLADAATLNQVSPLPNVESPSSPASSKENESGFAAADASANQAAFSNPLSNNEISLADATTFNQASPLPQLVSPSSPQVHTASNTALLLMLSPPQVEPADVVKIEQRSAPSVDAITHQNPVSDPNLAEPIYFAGTLPWFDATTMDWHVSWRQLALVQSILLVLDLWTLPFLVFYLASLYRVCLFPLPLSQLMEHDVILPRKGAFREDWDVPIRPIIINHAVSILCDILSFPLFVVARISWRGFMFAKLYQCSQPEPSPPVAAVDTQIQEEAPPGPVSQGAEVAPNQVSERQDPVAHRQEDANNHNLDGSSSLFVCIRELFLNQVLVSQAHCHAHVASYNFSVGYPIVTIRPSKQQSLFCDFPIFSRNGNLL
jgi:hypothetical protein